MPYIFKKYYSWRYLFFVFGEGLLIFLIINSIFIYWVDSFEIKLILPLYFTRAVIVTIVIQACFYYFDLYDLKIMPAFPDHMLKVLQTFGFSCIVLSFIYYSFPWLIISHKIFWCGFFSVGVGVFIWRFFYFKIIERRMFVQPIAVIGTGIFAQEILDAIDKNKDSGFKIVVFVGDPNPSIIQKNLAVIDNIKDLRDYCLNRVIGKIVVALDEKRGIPLYELIQYKFLGIEIVDGARFYEEVVGRIPVHRINPSWLVFSDGFHVSRLKKLFKRILDISAAMSGILVFFPVFLLTAFLIKLESAGGIFYFQNRVGENGKIFKIIKFRSMRKDAEINGPIWAAENDSRVTKIGRFIRKTRIDELPQLINVLRGDMSLVGPRPERPEFIENLAKDIPFYNNRHVVKPGITGWAQIYYSYGSSIDDALHKLEYDFYYIKNLSIVIDLMIIFQTIKVVLFGKGAR